jgi:glycerol-3-phosphate acyltransferase PlsY
MVSIFTVISIILVSYLIGSVPYGWLVVKIFSGKDVRQIESGRTGGTNAMRAAGIGAGILTAILDILKGAASVWLAKAVTDNVWLHILAPLAVILGNNYSIFLAERDANGRLRLRGGAGGAACVGGSLGLWAPSVLIILPLGALVFFGIGYASVTTMSAALIATVIFAVRAQLGLSPWQYILYGILAELLLLWALRPNIRRLKEGTERLHGWRAKRREKQTKE